MSSLLSDNTIVTRRVDGAVFDLDGVITRTARVHAAAWKAMFDDFLARRAGDDFEPFDIDTDYREYVDGKPRFDGVRSFLESRGIDLPEGDPDDAPEADTVQGLGKRKNALFLDKLKSDGVEVYDDTITLIQGLQEAGVATAVVSSSRNCPAVLEAAGIADLFDARVDGNEVQRLGLAGKPAPDIFREAVRRLGSTPQRSLGVEDAAAGVAAASAAGFGGVIGVDRYGNGDTLRRHGAHHVVATLGELRLGDDADAAAAVAELPAAGAHLEDILPGGGLRPALFLDYDGTLTPIVERPADAELSDTMHARLEGLAGLCPVAVVSGRDLADVRRRVDIDGLWYAGSHGFDIAGPGGERDTYQEGTDYLPALDAAEEELRDTLEGINGCEVERKRFSIAVHYRRVAETEVGDVAKAVEAARDAHRGLRLSRGKKVHELQPDVRWDKGRALRWLMEVLDAGDRPLVPIYLGDDVTDEDAFRELADPALDGVGIVVSTASDRTTHAAYRLDDPPAVAEFLDRLAQHLEARR